MSNKRYVIALGTFDGVHQGHRAVISACISLAREKSACSMVYTFLENPRSLFGKSPLTLMSAEEKQQKLTELGIERVEAVHFTRELADMPPKEFVALLVKSYNPVGFVCGEDYTFGCKAAGTSQMLKSIAAEYGIQTVIVPTVMVTDGSEKISSTLIRKAIQTGDAARAQKLLSGENDN